MKEDMHICPECRDGEDRTGCDLCEGEGYIGDGKYDLWKNTPKDQNAHLTF